MEDWEIRITDIKNRIAELRAQIDSDPQPQESVEEPKEVPQKSAKDAEMDALKAKLLGKKK